MNLNQVMCRVLSVFQPASILAGLKKLGWWYIGLMYFAIGMGVCPWSIYQFWDNILLVETSSNTKGGVNVGMDWARQPEAHHHGQILMHKVAMLCRPSFEFAMECFAK